MAKWMYNFCGWCPDLCMTHRALLYCGYTEFYQLSCVSKMSSWFFCTIMKGPVIPPVVESRAGFTGPYNVCNKYIPLSGSPCLPTSAWRQRWVTGWAQHFCFPSFLLLGSFQGGKGIRVSQPLLCCFVKGQSSGCPIWLPTQNFFLSYAQIIWYLDNIRHFSPFSGENGEKSPFSVTGRNLWSQSNSEAQTGELPGSSANLFTSGWMLTLK